MPEARLSAICPMGGRTGGRRCTPVTRADHLLQTENHDMHTIRVYQARLRHLAPRARNCGGQQWLSRQRYGLLH